MYVLFVCLCTHKHTQQISYRLLQIYLSSWNTVINYPMVRSLQFKLFGHCFRSAIHYNILDHLVFGDKVLTLAEILSST